MKGLLFGVFDFLHEGHKHFISEAASQCDDLIVVVASSETTKELKGKEPKQSLEERMHAIENWNKGVTVRAGDARLGSWKVIMEEKPDVIFLGYDQKSFREAVEEFRIRVVVLSAYKPDIYKTTLLRESE